jgi:hypothetical protein
MSQMTEGKLPQANRNKERSENKFRKSEAWHTVTFSSSILAVGFHDLLTVYLFPFLTSTFSSTVTACHLECTNSFFEYAY